jgi:hypothetical protein
MDAKDLTFGIDYVEFRIMRSWSEFAFQSLCY